MGGGIGGSNLYLDGRDIDDHGNVDKYSRRKLYSSSV